MGRGQVLQADAGLGEAVIGRRTLTPSSSHSREADCGVQQVLPATGGATAGQWEG